MTADNKDEEGYYLRNRQLFQEFIATVREAKFLFDDKDGIFEALSVIQKKLGTIHHHTAPDQIAGLKPNAEDIFHALGTVDSDLMQLEQRMTKYLYFGRLT